jgi:hypothetical protein
MVWQSRSTLFPVEVHPPVEVKVFASASSIRSVCLQFGQCAASSEPEAIGRTFMIIAYSWQREGREKLIGG